MAERRMFARSVIGSARFLRMPSTSRLLYYDLGMQADDDGVVEAFSVMRTTGANEDDLRVLASRGFVEVLNDDFVTHITDWSRNNYIQKDRYRPSIYAGLLVRLNAGKRMDTWCIQNVSELETQERPGEERPGEDRPAEGEERPAALPPSRARFSPPAVEEVEAYCRERGSPIDPAAFVDYYTARGWRYGGGQPMKDWQAAVRSWEKREDGRRRPRDRARTGADYGEELFLKG